MLRANAGINIRIAAITDRGSYYAYPRQVRWEIEQDDKASYAAAGEALSRARVALVSLQHEFGLWGDAGDLAPTFDQYDCAPAFLDALEPDEWRRSGVHTESGPYSVEDWLRIYADHAHDHADQIRRAREAARANV